MVLKLSKDNKYSGRLCALDVRDLSTRKTPLNNWFFDSCDSLHCLEHQFDRCTQQGQTLETVNKDCLEHQFDRCTQLTLSLAVGMPNCLEHRFERCTQPAISVKFCCFHY